MLTKSLSAAVVCAFALSSSVLLAAAPKEILAPVEKVFIAAGYDDNDNIQISLYGNFTDTCYRVGPTGFTVDHGNHKIKVWAKAYDYSSRETGGVCLDILTPFLLNVSIGVLPEGQYKIEVNAQTATADLDVAKSTSDSPDDYLYAPVTQSKIEAVSGQSSLKATISGTFPRLYKGCMVMKTVRSYRTPQNILVVLPISEMELDETICKNTKLNFEASIPFSPFEDTALLHVRVANGLSQTQLIDSH